mmetsp:Transcript_26283/g.51606  ORF Transcript_26283/g.51606 Transcript_26283/m.51606 type:complete len:142 (+) Transcript_26283:941-1366(+)
MQPGKVTHAHGMHGRLREGKAERKAPHHTGSLTRLLEPQVVSSQRKRERESSRGPSFSLFFVSSQEERACHSVHSLPSSFLSSSFTFPPFRPSSLFTQHHRATQSFVKAALLIEALNEPGKQGTNMGAGKEKKTGRYVTVV